MKFIKKFFRVFNLPTSAVLLGLWFILNSNQPTKLGWFSERILMPLIVLLMPSDYLFNQITKALNFEKKLWTDYLFKYSKVMCIHYIPSINIRLSTLSALDVLNDFNICLTAQNKTSDGYALHIDCIHLRNSLDNVSLMLKLQEASPTLLEYLLSIFEVSPQIRMYLELKK